MLYVRMHHGGPDNHPFGIHRTHGHPLRQIVLTEKDCKFHRVVLKHYEAQSDISSGSPLVW